MQYEPSFEDPKNKKAMRRSNIDIKMGVSA